MEILSFVFDAKLLPWVAVICALTFWLKKKGTPSWLPLPALVFVISFVVSTLFGFLVDDNPNGFEHAIMSVLYYGLGNGIVITLVSCYGYDFVHAITKAKSGEETTTTTAKTTTTKTTATKTALTDDEKKALIIKYVIYTVSGLAGLCVASLIASLAFGLPNLFAFFVGVAGFGFAYTIARAIYHVAHGDNATKTWAITIYGLFSSAAWLVATLATTWLVSSIALALSVLTLVLAIGYRFIDKEEK